ncbi:DegT/DnrJ/EryC1/StrS family aminotransferase, partial [Desulfobaculum sp.]
RWNAMSYPVRLAPDAPEGQHALMQRLLDAGIATRPGVMNAHTEAPYRTALALPQSEAARAHVVLLPIFNTMTDEQADTVVREVRRGH